MVNPTTTTIPQTTVSPSNTTLIENVTINIQPGWNLLSTPLPVSNIPNIYPQLQTNCGLSNNEKLWGYNNATASYQWINGPGSALGTFENYEEYMSTSTGNGTITGGGGYWFYSSKQCSINTQAPPISAVYADYIAGHLPSLKINTRLSQGWNLIGVPFIMNSTTTSDMQKANSCNLKGGFYTYNPSTNTYTMASTLNVGAGYWVYANNSCSLNWASYLNNGNGLPPSSPAS